MNGKVYYKNRLEKVLKMISDLSIDSVLFSEPGAVQYLTGLPLTYLGVSMPTLVTAQGKVLAFSLKLGTEEAINEIVFGEVLDGPADPSGLESLLMEKIESLGVKELGVDYGKISYGLAKKLSYSLGSIKDVSFELDKLRSRKDAMEIRNIAKAIGITEIAHARAKEMICEGVTERQIATGAVTEMLKNGADWFAFSPLVASGKRSAYPHGSPTHKALRKGELVFVDLGARCEGYWSDVTRTYTVGDAGSKELELYSVINEASEASMKAIKPGVKGKDVDAAARQVIDQRGYSQYFTHGVGHGIGINSGYPMLDPSSDHILEKDQTVTIEPGIYIPGYGGIRIEEDVLVTEDGALQLSTFPRTLD
jgi:Xaa-Pro aminopeptidase